MCQPLHPRAGALSLACGIFRAVTVDLPVVRIPRPQRQKLQWYLAIFLVANLARFTLARYTTSVFGYQVRRCAAL
jgi:hypothetical protein